AFQFRSGRGRARVHVLGDGEDCCGGRHAGGRSKSGSRSELARAAGRHDRVREGELARAAVAAAAGECNKTESLISTWPPKLKLLITPPTVRPPANISSTTCSTC